MSAAIISLCSRSSGQFVGYMRLSKQHGRHLGTFEQRRTHEQVEKKITMMPMLDRPGSNRKVVD